MEQAPASPGAEAGNSAQTMRVPLDRFNQLSDLIGEQIVQHSGLGQQLDRLGQLLEDMLPTVDRLRRLGADLEGRPGQVTSVVGQRIALPVHTVAPSVADARYAAQFEELEIYETRAKNAPGAEAAAYGALLAHFSALKVGEVLNTHKMKKHFDLEITDAGLSSPERPTRSPPRLPPTASTSCAPVWLRTRSATRRRCAATNP
jgi:hypothetical protein